MKKLITNFLIVLSTIGSFSQSNNICTNFILSEDSILFNSEVESKSITIKCNANYWHIDNLSSWLKTNLYVSNKDTSIVFTVQKNKSPYNDKDTTISIWGSCNFYHDLFTNLYIYQKKAEPFLTFPDSVIIIEDTAKNCNINYSTNLLFDVAIKGTWLQKLNSNYSERIYPLQIMSINPDTFKRYAGIDFIPQYSGYQIKKVQIIQKEGKPILTSSSKYYLDSDSKSKQIIQVNSNINWQISTDKSWLNLSKLRGFKNDTLLISAIDSNTDTINRQATIILKGKNVEQINIQVIQNGKLVKERPIFESEGDTFSFTIQSSKDAILNVIPNDIWITSNITCTGCSSPTIDLIASKNTSLNTRKSLVQVKINDEILFYILIHQKASNPFFLFSVDTISFESSLKLSSKFEIISNTDWAIEKNASWVSIDILNGNSSKEINVFVDENPFSENRNTKIYLLNSNFVRDSIAVYQEGVAALILKTSNINKTFYPNPASTKLYLQQFQKFDKLLIYSVEGKNVLETKSQTEIDISMLNRGLYVLILESKDRHEVYKFIKK